MCVKVLGDASVLNITTCLNLKILIMPGFMNTQPSSWLPFRGWGHNLHRSSSLPIRGRGLSIHIPTPCHENWDAMTPVQQGRFCQSCAKQVVDFSLMTDQEVLNYFNKNTGNTCGRFNSEQLQRPLQPTKQEKKKAWWVAALMPVLMLFEKGKAQTKDTIAAGDTAIVAKQVCTLIGDTVITSPNNNIHGKVIGEKGKPIANVLVNIGKDVFTKTDSAGVFTLPMPSTNDTIVAHISKPGYNTQKINIAGDTAEHIITLQGIEFTLTNDSLVKYIAPDSSIAWQSITAGFVTAVPEYPSSPFIDFFKNIFSPSPLTIFPNTLRSGERINVIIKSEGEFYLQLVDAFGKILFVEKLHTANVKTNIPVNIPSSLAIGAYFIYVVDERKKKKYSKKFLVI